MEKWDVHTHTVLSPATFNALEKFAARYVDFVRVRAHLTNACAAELVDGKGRVRRMVEPNAYDPVARIKDCDNHKVSVQVLSPTPMMIPDFVTDATDAAEICTILNDDNAALVARFPERFKALGALPMRHPDLAIEELDRIRALGFRGIEINSNIDGMELDNPLLFPVFQAAADMDMAVFIHPWGGFMAPTEERLKKRMNPERNWRPWLIGMGMETALAFDSLRCGGVHELLPKLRVLYGHGGGVFPALLGRLEHGAYCRPDLFKNASKLDPIKTVQQCGIYVDSLVHSEPVLRLLLETVGETRIALGSDYPYPLGEMDPFDAQTKADLKGNKCPYPDVKGIYPGHMIEHMALTEPQKQRLLFGTAKEWLGCV